MSATPDRYSPSLVSVVIPAYNAAGFIARALQSVLNQTWRRREIIVVNDGSDDDTASVVEGFGYERLRLINQANAGPAAARNRGVAEAKGELIAFLDADDEWLPRRLEWTVTPFIGNPAPGMSFCRAIQRRPGLPDIIYGGSQAARPVFPRVLWPPADQVTPATTCRKALFEALGGFDETLSQFEDRDLWIRFEEAAPVIAIPETLVVCHERAESLSATTDVEEAEAQYRRVIDRAFARCPDRYAPYRRHILALADYEWGVQNLLVGRASAARGRLSRSLIRRPTLSGAIHFAAALLPRRAIGALRRAKYALARRSARSR